MGLRKVITLVGALAGGISASQLPEFAQQYEQRLSGAVYELSLVVADFEKDAAAQNLTSVEALERYQASSDQFLKDRGQSMAKTIKRFKRLNDQLVSFQNANGVEQVYILGQNLDPEMVEQTLEIFEPAVPLTPTGFGFAALGLLLGGGMLRLIYGLLSWPFRRKLRISR